jgi:hypothetical protein
MRLRRLYPRADVEVADDHWLATRDADAVDALVKPVMQQAAGKAHGFKGRLHLLRQVSLQLLGPFGVLALSGGGHAARHGLLKMALVKMALGSVNGGLSAHGVFPKPRKVMAGEIKAPRCQHSACKSSTHVLARPAGDNPV